jgi:2-hydroxy-3-keto-5-methylthiopentenyl-1-phosphate phosphatase
VIIVSRYIFRHVRHSSDTCHSYALSGMSPLIRAVLSNLIGEEDASDIEIIANDVDVLDDNKWTIKYRHPSRWALLS